MWCLVGLYYLYKIINGIDKLDCWWVFTKWAFQKKNQEYKTFCIMTWQKSLWKREFKNIRI